jgi:hypothetical protein
MKKYIVIFAIVATLIACGGNGKSTEVIADSTAVAVDSTVGKSIRIGSLEVAQNDFPYTMNWDDAGKACASLGPGWRLPTNDELDTLYQNKDKIGGFTSNYYWSSTQWDFNLRAGLAWFHSFGYGLVNGGYKSDPFYVRAIRSF